MDTHNKKIGLAGLSAAIICLLLVSCSQREDINLGIRFNDNPGIYSVTFRSDITNGRYSFPKGIAVLIKTVDSISIAEIGSFATTEFNNNSNWKNWGEAKKTKQNAILILVSEKPQLCQVRFGENISLETYKAGLSFGIKYRQLQDTFISLGYEKGLEEILELLQKEIPPALKLSWFMKIEKPGARWALNELIDLSAPSDDTYTKFIFKPYSNLIHALNLYRFPLMLVMVNALILYLVVQIGKRLIKLVFGKSRLSALIMFGWGIISSVFFSIPFWGSIVFLSSFRIEDSLFAGHLGIPLIPFTSYPYWFSSHTQLWLALIIGIVVFAIDFGAIYLAAIGISSLLSSDRKQVENDMQENLMEILNQAATRAFRFAIFALFMPMAISLLLLFYYILKIPKAVSVYIKLNKLNI